MIQFANENMLISSVFQSTKLNPIENIWGNVQLEFDGLETSFAKVIFNNILKYVQYFQGANSMP